MSQRKPRTTRKTLRLVGYVRVSTDEQARRGVSLGAQRKRLKGYALGLGMDLVAIKSDEGKSGKIAPRKRPGLLEALEMIRKGEADGLLVLKLDRLSRTTRHVLDLVDECNRDRWRFISVDEQLDTGTAQGVLVVTILAALAQMERQQIGERTRFALDSIAREGRARSYRTPFGWHTAAGSDRVTAGDHNPLVKNAPEQRILKRIVRMYRQGDGVRRIAGALNASNTGNPRTGGEWKPSTLAALLRTVERRELVAA
jgi:DNA invertase Pin-like site-specific DNA recombinase